MPALRLRPRSWIWRPVATRTALRQAASWPACSAAPVSRGAAVRACAAGAARQRERGDQGAESGGEPREQRSSAYEQGAVAEVATSRAGVARARRACGGCYQR